jgi:hypothetical protein
MGSRQVPTFRNNFLLFYSDDGGSGFFRNVRNPSTTLHGDTSTTE